MGIKPCEVGWKFTNEPISLSDTSDFRSKLGTSYVFLVLYPLFPSIYRFKSLQSSLRNLLVISESATSIARTFGLTLSREEWIIGSLKSTTRSMCEARRKGLVSLRIVWVIKHGG